MASIYRYASLLLPLVLFTRVAEGLSDPISAGNSYLMSAVITGDDHYLGCGDDFQCSILPISGAQVHDGWTVHTNSDKTWGFRIREDSWALDVKAASDAPRVFSNNAPSSSLQGEAWGLYSWPDGTYRLHNTFWKGDLDVKDNQTPFVNTKSGDTLLGQRWYFRSIAPQTTVTSTTTSTLVQNAKETSTTTVTVTTCLDKRSEADPTHLLRKRGAEVLSTTTQTHWITSTVTSTGTDGTQVVTSTNTVTSCAPSTVTASPSAASPSAASPSAVSQPGVTVIKGSSINAFPTPPPSTPTPTISMLTGGSTSTPSSGAVYSFQLATIGWILSFWTITMLYI